MSTLMLATHPMDSIDCLRVWRDTSDQMFIPLSTAVTLLTRSGAARGNEFLTSAHYHHQSSSSNLWWAFNNLKRQQE